MKKVIAIKGQKMAMAKTISIVASIFLVGGFGLSGCGSDSSSSATTAAPVTQDQNSVIVEQKGMAVIEGSVVLDMTSQDRTVKSTSSTSEIVAYNLNDNTQYTTTTDSTGSFSLSGLTQGNYQVVASSTSSTLRSVRQVDLTRETRQTVVINLQAAGNVKGNLIYAYPGTMVYIPGTSYMSTVDQNGNFELINVPVGEVTLFVSSVSAVYDMDIYTKNVSIAAGQTAELKDINPYMTSVQSADFEYADVSIGLQYEGINIFLNNTISLTDMVKYTSLVDKDGNKVELSIESSDNDNYGNYFHIKTAGAKAVAAGDYTLVVDILDGEKYEKTFSVKNKAAVFTDSSYNGFYNTGLGIAFAQDVANIKASDITVSDANGIVVAVNGIEPNDNGNYRLKGDFKTNTPYTVTLTGDLLAAAPDGVVYVWGNDYHTEFDSNNIVLDGVDIVYSNPSEGQKDVSPTNNMYFYVNNSQGLDLDSVKVTLGTQELTIKNGGLTTQVNQYWYGDSQNRSFYIKGAKLSYASVNTMVISAKDSYGTALSETVAFTTITPQTVGLLPEVNDVMNNMNDYYGYLRAYFNVPVDEKSGTITLHDDTNNKDVQMQMDESQSVNIPYANITNTPYHVGYNPSELLPNTTYTMKVSGFKAESYLIADRSVTFKTPSKHLRYTSVENGQYIIASNLQNRIEFNFFGALTQEEKDSLVNNLKITSSNLSMLTDKSHPVPLVVWAEDEYGYGEKLILAFTIEDGKSYEIDFSASSVAESLGIPHSKLTFMTQMQNNTSESTDVVVDMFSYAYINNELSLNGDKVVASGYVDVRVPQYITPNGNYDSSSCNYSDVNSSKITKWFSADVNVTYTSAYNSYDYHNGHYEYMYDQYGNMIEQNYVSGYYGCDTIYSASFNVPADYNTVVEATITVPQDEIGEGITAKELSRTMTTAIAAADSYSVYNYYNGLEIHFMSPVKMSDVENLLITTNPSDLSHKTYSYYGYDINGTQYTKYVYVQFDSTQYSAFQYNLSGTVSGYKETTKESISVNVKESGTVYTQADLTPLEISSNAPTAQSTNSVALAFNRYVDSSSVITKDINGTVTKSAFVIKDDLNNTINITDAYSASLDNYGGYAPAVIFYLDENFKSTRKYTITQTQAIKASGSWQTLEAGYSKLIDVGDYPNTLSGEIKTDTYLTKDTVWAINGLVVVRAPAKLTIEAGTTLVGKSVIGSAKSYMIVDKGAQIIAEGTADMPIVFTSEIANNGGAAAPGQWGGLTLIGKAANSQVRPYEVNGNFVADSTDMNDSSGVLKYVQILNSGITMDYDIQMDGFSMVGVGLGTVVENITVINSNDDCMALWGGTVNLTNISLTKCVGDHLDIDEGYSGTVTNLTIVGDDTVVGEAGIEMSGITAATFENLNINMKASYRDGAIYFKGFDDVGGHFKNSTIVYDINNGYGTFHTDFPNLRDISFENTTATPVATFTGPLADEIKTIFDAQ